MKECVAMPSPQIRHAVRLEFVTGADAYVNRPNAVFSDQWL